MLVLPYMKYERIKERTEQAYNTVVPTNYTNKKPNKILIFHRWKSYKKIATRYYINKTSTHVGSTLKSMKIFLRVL